MTLLRLVLIFVLAATLFAQDQKPAPQYEMTTYVLGLLHKGPQWGVGTKDDNKRIQEGHMANIRRMAAAGKLIVAGPLSDNGDIRGIFIFRASSPDEVRSDVDQDPAVKAGHLVVELHPWFAAAGLRVNDPK